MIKADAIFKIHKLTKFFFGGFLLLLLVGIGNKSFGQAVGDYGTRYTTGTYNWNRASNWVVCVTAGTWTGATTATSVPANNRNVWIRTGSTYTMDDNPGSCNNLTINGTLSWSNNNRTLNASGNLVISGGTLNGTSTGILNVAGTFTVPASTTASIERITVTITGATSIAGTINFDTSSTGTKIFTGLFTVETTGIVNNTINESITFRGGLTNNGTFTAGTGTYTFDTNNQAITGTLSIPNVTVTGITLTNNGIFTVGTALSGSGGLTQSATGLLNLGGTSVITTLTAATAGNTVSYTDASQTVKSTTYNNLILSGSGTKSIASGTSVTGNLSISGPTASIAAGLNITVSSLTLGGLNKINGTWGSTTATTATYHDNAYFAATTGYLTVTTDTRPTSAFAGITASQSICYSTASVTFTGTVSAGTIYPAIGETVSVTINGVTQNATIAGGVGGFSINFNTVAIPSSVTPYTITYAYAGNVNLKAAPNNTSTTLTVNPATAISSQSTATQTQCINGTFTPISVTASGTGTITYQWYSNTIASTTGGTLLTGATSASYTPLATVAGTLYYYCIVHSNCGANVTSSISGAFIVNSVTAISSQSTATQTQCSGGTFTSISVTATGGGLTYQWYSNTIASTSGGTSLGTGNGAQTSSYTPQTTFEGTLYYYCIVNGTCGSAVTSGISGAFIVNPATAISSQSTATQTQCINGTFTAISVTASGTGTITYQWYSNTIASTTGGTLLTGATSASYTPLATVAGTLYYYCIVHSNCGANVTSSISGAFIVNSVTAISSQSTATQTQCSGGTFTSISVTATGGGLTYQWYSNTIASTSGGTSLGTGNGAQTSSYTPQTTFEGTLYYYCIVNGTCGSAVTSGISGAFIVNAAPIAPTLNLASPANGSIICAGYNVGTVTGTGGSGGSVGAVNEYHFSINGGTSWNTYTSGAAITTTGATTSVIVQSRRTGGTYCANSEWSTICIWTVGSTPTAPALSMASPANGTIICTGFNTGTVTGAAGSGGSTGAADQYRFSINGGTSWNTYINGGAITTTGATGSVIVQSLRTGGNYGCSNSAWVTISTWTLGSTPIAPTLNVASPANGSIICTGFNTGTVTGTGGSGGSTGAVNEYQISINGGGNYSVYTNGAAIITTGATGSVIVQARRTGGDYGCNNTAWSTLSTWTVRATPAPPITTGATICYGIATTLSASGAIAGETYKWYSAATGGTLLKTSANEADNTYTTPVLASTTNYWVSILGAGGCESSRTQVTATFPAASPDDQNATGSDYWIGHAYDGTNFTTYYGSYVQSETFDQNFGGDLTCFSLNSSLGNRSIYTETFSVHYRMNSTKKGLYMVNLGSDDGSRLTVDGTLLYNNWVDQGYTARTGVLLNLNGASSLVYDYYENGGGNRVVFQSLATVMSNVLTNNTFQSIPVGGTWATISGNVFGTLPAGISLSGTGYQWTYSTTPSGTRTNISGATGPTFTPNATVAPFNAPGTYYIFRKVSLSSVNNVSPNPYVATNESDAAVLTMSNLPTIITSTTALTGFSYPLGFGPSAEQSFIVSGSNLNANLTVTPSANFEISTGTGASFVATNPITLLVNGGNVSATTIYVRLKAGLPLGAVPAENIVCASNGLTPKNVACSGAVTSVPIITTSLTSLSGFSYPYTAGPSSQQTFTVSGTNLIANVTVTPSASFEISTTSGSGFVSTPVSITQTDGTLNATTIYVRLKAGLGIGGYSENIVSSSTSATSKNVTCNGTVNGSNTISLSTSSLAGFMYTSGAGPSAPQSFNVSGTMLTNNMVITPATNYEISFSSGSGYQSTPLTIIPSGGTVTATPIYVRLKSGLAVGTYPPDNIPVSSAGAITKSVGCSGAVVNTPTIMVSKSTLTGFGYMSSDGGPSSSQYFTVSGSSLLANVSITPPANYEISLSSGSGYQSTPISLTQTGGVLSPATIYARLISGLPSGNYNGVNIVVASGAITQNVACIGIVFVSPLITAGINPGTACAGSTVNLTSVGESTILNRFWQGPNSFYSTLQNPVLTNVTSAMTGTYTVTGNVVVGGNLVTNGDFELGNSSFGSSYALAAQTVDGLWPESTYDVLVDPHTRHANFASCPDHTTGTGKQMVVNGSPVAGAVIWTQSVPVIPGASYEFTYWVQSVVALAPSQLQLYINGVAVGPVYTADLATCSWKQFAYNATSGSNTSLNLELINQNTIANGNDFALDDIVFQQILPASSSVDLTVNPNLPVSVSLVASPNPTTTGTEVTFIATPVNGGLTPGYRWFVNGTNVASGFSPTYSSSTLSDGDIVTCELTSSLTCVTGNPATSNTVIMMISLRVNYWHGTLSTDWGTQANWTANYIPAAGDDVEFATAYNNGGSPAQRDLYLDINRTIGSLIDSTIRSTVIPSNKKLTVNRNLYLVSSAHINASAQYSTIEFAGILPQTIPAATFTNDEVYDILINNSSNVTLYGTMRLLHEITANAGRLDATITMPTVVYAGDPYAKQTIEMNRYLDNGIYNLGIYNLFGVWLATTASIKVPHDCTITRGVLTVPPGATLTVDNYTNLDYRAPEPALPHPQIDYWSCLVLKSDSILTGSFVHSDLFSSTVPPQYGSGPGTVKIERYMSHTNNWHLYSSPIKDQSVRNFLKYNPEIPDLFRIIPTPEVLVAAGMRDYNTVTNLWNPYFYYPTTSIDIGSIGLGKGFNIRTIYNYNDTIGSGRVDATGVPNLNTVNVNLARSATPTDYGWNCIGNPFTCALNIRNANNDGFLCDINSILKNTLQLDPNYIAVYLWDTNNITGNIAPQYIVINNATTITSVQAGQGFFVKSKIGGGTVTFNKAMQLPNAALSFKAAVIEWPSLKIVARDQTSSRSTEIKFVTNSTKGLDPGYDAGLYRTNPDFEIYSKLVEDNTIDYTLQCLPDQDYVQYEIPIGIDYKAGGQIIFTAETVNLPLGCQAVLEDRLTKSFIRLDLKGAMYKATIDRDTKGTGRFFLHTYDVIGANQPSKNKELNVFSIAKNIYITGEVSEDARFYLYAVNGKLLANFTAQNQLQNQLDASAFASGVYLLTIIDRNQRKTIKFVLEN